MDLLIIIRIIMLVIGCACLGAMVWMSVSKESMASLVTSIILWSIGFIFHLMHIVLLIEPGGKYTLELIILILFVILFVIDIAILAYAIGKKVGKDDSTYDE